MEAFYWWYSLSCLFPNVAFVTRTMTHNLCRKVFVEKRITGRPLDTHMILSPTNQEIQLFLLQSSHPAVLYSVSILLTTNLRPDSGKTRMDLRSPHIWILSLCCWSCTWLKWNNPTTFEHRSAMSMSILSFCSLVFR